MLAKQLTKKVLLTALLVFSFAYRLLLMTRNTFPPGADIGLHESVIKSITVGEPNLFFNYYQMGGGISATNPGYHLFVIFAITLTGAPDYLVHSMVVSFFSTIPVLLIFLIVRRIWSEPAAFIAAFLAAFSAGDISMLCWGGYPNLIALTLIPVLFYLFLQYSRFSLKVYLATTSLVVGALFLTHLFSALMFVAITVFTLFIGTLFSKWTRLSIRQAALWFIPIVFGALLVSPYLFNIVPVYFGSEGTITGSVLETKEILLATRLTSLEVVFLSFIPVFLFFLLSRYYKERYLTMSAVLSAAWILVPAVLTQSYLLGVYLDYERFKYFLFVPLLIFVALVIESVSKLLSQLTCRLYTLVTQRIADIGKGWRRFRSKPVSLQKFVYSALVLCLLLFAIFSTPILTTPDESLIEVSFYQVMTPSKYDAIQWINANTPTGSVLVSTAEFGWWLSGFAQRPTLSAANPKYLILAHEIEPAEVARNLLEFDYFINNGFMQVNYYPSHVDGNSFDVTAILDDSYVLNPSFSINDTQISLLYRDNGVSQHLDFETLPITGMRFENGSDWASFEVVMENQELTFTESVTVYAGVRFAQVSLNAESKVEGISFDWLHVPFLSTGAPTQYGDSIGFVDSSVNGLTQMIFPENLLGTSITMKETPNFFELVNNLEGESMAEMEFFVGFYPYQPPESIQDSYFDNLMANNSETYLNKVSNLSLAYFDYLDAIKDWNISYIVVATSEAVSRFSADPIFTLVYKNDEVAVFHVLNTP